MAKNKADIKDWMVAPIRTYAEVAAEMRRRGDAGMKTCLVGYYERRALEKLRILLADLENECDAS